MTINDLTPFCCDDNSKSNITHPWTGEGYTQATNGMILIRVSPVDGVKPSETAPVTGSLFPKHEPSDWVEVSGIKLAATETCPVCNGEVGTVKCPECHGDGEVEFENRYNDYTVECKTCEGEGEIRCRNCSGAGKVDGINTVGEAKFSTVLLRLLVPLPNCRIGVVNDCAPAWFRFDGGDGLIMPIG